MTTECTEITEERLKTSWISGPRPTQPEVMAARIPTRQGPLSTASDVGIKAGLQDEQEQSQNVQVVIGFVVDHARVTEFGTRVEG